MSKLKDLTGKKFGRLVVIEKSESLNGHTRWLCRCDCGNFKIIHKSSLLTGNTTSCGCYKVENAKKLYSGVRQNDLRLYAVWNGIKQRCGNKKSKSYMNYGARGIKVCKEWANSYENFYYWAIENGYTQGKQIDRIDNDKGYNPQNCRWVYRSVQANNKRNNVFYSIGGKNKTLAQWCKEYEIDYFLVSQRIKKLGWDIEKALTTPKLKKAKKGEVIYGKNI